VVLVNPALALPPMDPTTMVILLMYVFPIGFALSIVLHIFFWLWTPKPAKVISRARFRRSGSFFADYDDSGVLRLRFGRPTGMEGVFDVGKELFTFTPTPLPVESDPGGNPHSDLSVTPNHYEEWNKAVTTRAILEGTNKSIYFGSQNKGISMPPKAITNMDDALNKAVKGKKKEKEKKTFKTIPFDIIKFFLEMDFGPQRMLSIGERFYLKGKFGKYKKGIDPMIVGLGIIIIVCIIGALVLSGTIDVSQFKAWFG